MSRPKSTTPHGVAGGPDSPSSRVRAIRDRWAHVWFSAAPDDWKTLVVVPAAPAFHVLAAAEAFTAAGRAYDHFDVMLVDAMSVAPGSIGEVVQASARRSAEGLKTVIAVASPFANPAAIAISRSADGVLLAVPLGATRIAHARSTIDIIGRHLFIGAITIGADGSPLPED